MGGSGGRSYHDGGDGLKSQKKKSTPQNWGYSKKVLGVLLTTSAESNNLYVKSFFASDFRDFLESEDLWGFRCILARLC